MFPFLLNWSPQMRGIIHYERRLFFTQCLKSGKRRHNNHHHFIMCCWCLPKVKLLSSVTVPIQNCILSLAIIYDVCNWKQSQRSNLSCRLQRDQIWRNFTTLAKLWKSLGNFSKLNLVLEKRLKHLLGNCYAFGSIYIFINGPILKIISPTGHTGGKKSLHSSLWYTLHWRQLCSIYYSTTLYEMLRIVPRPFSLLTNNNTMNERMKEWSVAVGLKILSNYGPKVDLKAAKPLLQIFFPFFHFAVSSFSWQMTI